MSVALWPWQRMRTLPKKQGREGQQTMQGGTTDWQKVPREWRNVRAYGKVQICSVARSWNWAV